MNLRVSMTRNIFLFILLVISLNVKAEPVIFDKPLSPRIANYDIDVKLYPEKRLLKGTEKLVWFNKTDKPCKELWFHLYQNAFRNDRSSFMKESRETMKEKKIEEKNFGFIDVDKISLESGEDLTGYMKFAHPDDENEEDKTVFFVPLPEPVLPGGRITVNIEFTERVPEPPIARSGSRKEYFFVSQWFPKIGVFEDGKWNCHQYHSHTEFYSDFGVYNVRITVPKGNIVGATGIEVSKKDNSDGTVTHFYHAEDVHDFAWTTSPNFVEFTAKEQDVDIRVLLQKSHKSQSKRHIEATKLAIGYFQDWYGDYPFPNITVVDPRRGAKATGGMEYPTLITAGTFRGLPKGLRAVESVIIHEFGHNYWYHLVASNEFEESWLDEGINTYSEIQIMRDIYGEKASLVDLMGIKVDDLKMRRYSYIVDPDKDPVVKNGWEYYSAGSYRACSYSKPALMLITLENYLGRETMQKILRTYFERFKFKHPKTKDFIAVANEVSGKNLEWFFNQALYTNSILDYSVDKVLTIELKEGKGYDYSISTEEVKEKPGKVEEKSKRKPKPNDEKNKMYYSEVNIRRLGGFQFPVEVEIKFENGEKVIERWDGKELWKRYTYIKPSKMVYAKVDPELKVPLDINWKNNTKTIKEQIKEEKKATREYLDMMKFLLHPQNQGG